MSVDEDQWAAEDRWRERMWARFGPIRHMDERTALRVLSAAGIDTDGATDFGVFALLAPTRRAARAWQITNRLRHVHASWGPVMVEGGWLYVLDIREALGVHGVRR